MLFKLGYTIVRLDVRGSVEIQFDGKTVQLRAPTQEELEIGHKTNNALLEIIVDLQPSPKSLPVFEAFLEGRRPPERGEAESADDLIHRDGPEYGLHCYPPPFVTFVEKVGSDLGILGRQIASLVRWRYHQEGPPSPVSTRGLSCSADSGNTWQKLPANYGITNVTPPHSVLSSESVNPSEMLALLSRGLQEPLAHELLREAKELKHESLRSSLLISVSAAEVGIKELLSNKVPDADWLINSIQSPPIINILTEYLPVLFENIEAYYQPDRKVGLVKSLNDAVTIRNQLVHRGAIPPTLGKLDEILAAVENLLWTFDCLAGFDWAEYYVTGQDPKH